MIIHHHLGLGDHFVCNGLVNYLSQNEYIHLICKKHNLPTIQSLYSENKNVNIVGIDGINEQEESYNYSKIISDKILYIGFHYCDPNNWAKSFYNQVNLNFSIRYEWFRLPSNLPNQIKTHYTSYSLVHNESSENVYNIHVPNDQIVFVNKHQDNNMLSYLKLIENANEIHCIDSSFFHLVDSISCKTHKLFYHDIRKNSTKLQPSSKWQIVLYDNSK